VRLRLADLAVAAGDPAFRDRFCPATSDRYILKIKFLSQNHQALFLQHEK
jgi:hypothetical protein